MNGAEMRAIRKRLNLDELGLARQIGYTGTDRNDITRIREYERDKKQIPLYIARLVWLIGETVRENLREAGQWPHAHEIDDDGRIFWPQWPGYEFDHSPDPGPDDAIGYAIQSYRR